MKFVLEAPESLYMASTIIDGMEQKNGVVTLSGRYVDNNNINTKEWNYSQWGFETTDVTSISDCEKIYNLMKMVEFARKYNKSCEFLFYIYPMKSGGAGLWIYYREKKQF